LNHALTGSPAGNYLIIDIDNFTSVEGTPVLTAVEVPHNLAAAQQALAAGGTLLAGGTHLMPSLTDRAFPPIRLVSLRRAGLDMIEVRDSAVTLGATTTLATIEADQRLRFLHECVRSIASPPVRSLATVGGNLFVPQPYGDLAVALLALDAEVEIAGAAGTRREALQSVLTAGISPDEIVASVHLTVPASGEFRFHKAARRRFNSASIVTVAARVATSDNPAGTVGDIRVAVGGLATTPLRGEVAERLLVGKPLDVETIRAAAEAMQDVIAPFDDAYSSAWYRRRVFPVHLRRALLGT
jgi:CO/xanthine dehydrogenase FAD-binding subunit